MTNPSKASRPGIRLVELNALRGLAVMGVMFFLHYHKVYSTFIGRCYIALVSQPGSLVR